MIDPVFMCLTIVSSNYPYMAVYVIKMLCLKLFKIYLNIVLETVVFDIQGCILIESVYNKLVYQVMVSYCNIESLSKEGIQICIFEFVRFGENV